MSEADRLEALEFKIAHLERGLQELSDVVVRQQRDIDELTARLKTLGDRLLELRELGPVPPEADEVPPHY